LYGCETWFLTLRDEHRFRLFQNRVLRNTFGSTRGEVTGDWRKCRNEELRYLYSSQNIISVTQSTRKRRGGTWHVEGRRRNAYRVLVRRKEATEDLDVDGRIILEWILKKRYGRAWTQDRYKWQASIKRRQILD
jgi:hypothetical protein